MKNSKYEKIKKITNSMEKVLSIIAIVIIIALCPLIWCVGTGHTIAKVALTLYLVATCILIVYTLSNKIYQKSRFKNETLESYVLWCVAAPILVATLGFLFYNQFLSNIIQSNIKTEYLISWFMTISIFVMTSIWVATKLFKKSQSDFQLYDLVLQATITVITIFSLAVNYQSNVYLKCQFVFIACYYFSLQLFVKGVQYYRKEKENNLKNKRRSRSFSKNNNREDTKKWNVARTRIIVIEISLIVIGVIIATVILKYQSQKEILYKDKGSMESFRIGLLGIQATIITLTISVVALISNNISEMYLGIAVSDYYLNKRPFIFKQNRIIYIGLMLLVGSILSYSNDKYIWQYYFFTITVSLILLSVTEIYALFRGSASSKNEIQLFIECSIRKSGNVKKKQILFKNFIDDWTDKSADQNYKQYEKYKKTLFLFFSELVLYNEMEVLNDIKSGCASEILSLLNSREELIQGRGII